MNGNAITVSPGLYAALKNAADGDIADPMVSARALARVVMDRKSAAGAAHIRHDISFFDAQLSTALLDGGGRRRSRSGRAAGGAAAALYGGEPRQRHVDGFCVGAPWNSVAVDLGIGHILHLCLEILQRAGEKVLAVRARWARTIRISVRRLVRAHGRAGRVSSRT